jgi:two-component system response regulator QseB
MRILLIEDDQLLGDAIVSGLKQHMYSVDWLNDGDSALSALTLPNQTENFDAIILDLGLPKRSGIDILKTIRKKGIQTPVMILTARNNIQDKVNGLDQGADDYLTKPFDLSELCARLRSITRRGDTTQTQAQLSLGDLVIDQAAHKVFIRERQVEFSRREFTLLSKLIEMNGKVVTREMLSQALYGWGDDVDSNAIEVHIHHIRKKINNAISIKTIRGVGYIAEES